MIHEGFDEDSAKKLDDYDNKREKLMTNENIKNNYPSSPVSIMMQYYTKK